MQNATTEKASSPVYAALLLIAGEQKQDSCRASEDKLRTWTVVSGLSVFQAGYGTSLQEQL